MAQIELQNVEKTFVVWRKRGRLRRRRELVRAVDGVDFAVERGSMVGYVGPNGAGKSTTVKMLTGILVPSAGRISVAGLEPARQLSLGQRVRGELTAAMLHDPEILFLDEPTIGLDVVAKARVREFLADVNHERGVTVLLTTHDLADIERLCERMLIIDHGRVIYDGGVEEIKERYGGERTVVVDL